jgi:hypothetical protein
MNILLALVQLVAQYWSDFLVVILFLLILTILWKRGQKKFVQKVIKDLVIKAEIKLGSKTGELKAQAAYNMLPTIVKMFLTFDEVKQIIKEAADWLKQKQEENPDMNLLSYAEELNAKPKAKTTAPKGKAEEK